MSKIAKIPVEIKEGATVVVNSKDVEINGPKGNMSYSIPEGILVKMEENKVLISQKNEKDRKERALSGLVRANIANMIKGVTVGFEKKLELSGVGYRAQASGNSLTLSLGFSHPVVIKGPEEIIFSVSDNVITVSGINKVLVGDMASKIRSIRPPEPYKGKGIKYQGEKIRRKAGKAAKAVGGK